MRQKERVARRPLPGHNGRIISRDLLPRLVEVDNLKSLGHEARKHSAAQVNKIAGSLQRFGCVTPILIDAAGRVVAGWAVLLAARQAGLRHISAITITDLSEPELRALRLALNRLAEDATWDQEKLVLEITEIMTQEIEIPGFETGEIDHALIGDAGLAQEDDAGIPRERTAVVTRKGDLWRANDHRLFCGDALQDSSYGHLLGDEKAQMVFTDPPFNVAISNNVSGLGRVKHRDFVMGSGEFTSAGFTNFLTTALGNAASHSVNGAVHFVCCDWRHILEMHTAGGQVYGEQLNLCVWNKTNAGMGSLYRSKYELIFVYKVGKGAHINNVALGKYGRNRTNVWDYVSQNVLNGTSKSKLSLHPTVKPIAMIADAICDCSERGAIILDPFGGAGTTIIAAERTGRRARVIELDPIFVDVSIDRWQRLTGGTAILDATGEPFATVVRTRNSVR
jgi:DNA modification methylase